MMAVWTPGSYLVREYARHLEDISATGPDGKPLDARQGAEEPLAGADRRGRRGHRLVSGLRADDVGAGELGGWLVRAAQRRGDVPDPGRLRPATARGHAGACPPAWKTSVTGLPAAADRQPHHYVAADFDTLVDSPIYAGNPAIYEFQVDGVPHYLVNEGEGGLWDGPRSARDVEAIVRAQKAFWGSLPYEKYVFFNLLTESGGGLEHKNSTVLMASRWATRTRSSYLSWLNLVSHEYLPHLERQAAAARRARPVRLRERGLHAQPLGRRGDHQLLRPAAGPPGRAVHASRSTWPATRPRPAPTPTRPRTTSSGSRPRPAGWSSRWRRRRSTPGSSSTAATRTPRTPASATTSRGPWSPSCSMPRSARRPAARRASTT